MKSIYNEYNMLKSDLINKLTHPTSTVFMNTIKEFEAEGYNPREVANGIIDSLQTDLSEHLLATSMKKRKWEKEKEQKCLIKINNDEELKKLSLMCAKAIAPMRESTIECGSCWYKEIDPIELTKNNGISYKYINVPFLIHSKTGYNICVYLGSGKRIGDTYEFEKGEIRINSSEEYKNKLEDGIGALFRTFNFNTAILDEDIFVDKEPKEFILGYENKHFLFNSSPAEVWLVDWDIMKEYVENRTVIK